MKYILIQPKRYTRFKKNDALVKKQKLKSTQFNSFDAYRIFFEMAL